MTSSQTDVREGGRWSLGQRVKNDVLFAIIASTLRLTTILPARALTALGRVVGEASRLLVPSWRRRTRDNLALAFPEMSPQDRARLAQRAFRDLGSLLGDAVASLDDARPSRLLQFAPGSREVLSEAIARGRGVVFASAHLGPWERVASSLVHHGVPLTVVAREPYDPRLIRIYDRLRRGVRAIYRGRRTAPIELVRVLRGGGVLGIPMDLSTRAPSIDAPFFGARAPTAIGPARLALRTRAEVVVGTAAPADDDGELVMSFVRVDTSELSGSREARETALTTLLNAELTRRIRALPSMWPWMHDRFPTRPTRHDRRQK